MRLADTSVWVDHLRSEDKDLKDALLNNEIVCHPYIVAEIALGSLKNRAALLTLLDDLPRVKVAADAEIHTMIENKSLYSRGIGYVDAALLTSAALTPDVVLWTRDKRLGAVAAETGL